MLRKASTTVIHAHKARAGFGALLDRVHKGEAVVISRRGRPVAAMIPLEQYERLLAEREARFAVVDRLHERIGDVPEEEVLANVAEAILAVRSERRHL